MITYLALIYQKTNMLNKVSFNAQKLKRFTEDLKAYEALNEQLAKQYAQVSSSVSELIAQYDLDFKDSFSHFKSLEDFEGLRVLHENFRGKIIPNAMESMQSLMIDLTSLRALNCKLVPQISHLQPIKVTAADVQHLVGLIDNLSGIENRVENDIVERVNQYFENSRNSVRFTYSI